MPFMKKRRREFTDKIGRFFYEEPIFHVHYMTVKFFSRHVNSEKIITFTSDPDPDDPGLFSHPDPYRAKHGPKTSENHT